jgi:enoyl-CoA hydratase
MADYIRYEVEEGVATVTIDRPDKRNAMTFAMLGEFNAALKRAEADDAARVLILTGSGGSFCAGTDLSDLSDSPPEERSTRGGEARDPSAWWPIAACSLPVIGAIDGAAVGMGAEFTSQCDVRIASTRARFAWNFAHRGLVPDTGAGSWLLPRLIGPSRALRLLYSGDFLAAEQALEFGYVAEVVEPEDLQAAAREEAARFLRGSPLSHGLTKRLVYEGLERDLPEHLAAHRAALETCFRSDDHREGVASFLERREARFTGK